MQQHGQWPQRGVEIAETGVALNIKELESRQAGWMTDDTHARTLARSHARTHTGTRMQLLSAGSAEGRATHARWKGAVWVFRSTRELGESKVVLPEGILLCMVSVA